MCRFPAVFASYGVVSQFSEQQASFSTNAKVDAFVVAAWKYVSPCFASHDTHDAADDRW